MHKFIISSPARISSSSNHRTYPLSLWSSLLNLGYYLQTYMPPSRTSRAKNVPGIEKPVAPLSLDETIALLPPMNDQFIRCGTHIIDVYVTTGIRPMTIAEALTCLDRSHPTTAKSSNSNVPRQPPRPSNSYILFRTHAGNILEDIYESKSAVTRVFGWTNMSRWSKEAWALASGSEKAHYAMLYQELKKAHSERYPGYIFQPKPKLQRKHRES